MLTYGFYNSIDHDRTYDAIQMSSIFDGIVRDGIFMSIGNCLRVIQDSGMTVIVDTGRAWFNHTWTLNDARLPITIPVSEVMLNRIDAIVLEVNASVSVRQNFIKVVKGTPATNPVRPTLINNNNVHQYPLAYITVNQRVTNIRQADITNMVGTSATPYVTGILQTVNIDSLVAQWEDQWKRFFENQTGEITATKEFWENEWEKWYTAQTKEVQDAFKEFIDEWEAFQEHYQTEMEDTGKYWKELWEKWFYAYVNDNSKDIADWKHTIDLEFRTWWDGIKDILDENCCATMADEIVEIKKQIEQLSKFKFDMIVYHTIWEPLFDDEYRKFDYILDNNQTEVLDNDLDKIISRTASSEDILDSDGDPIEFRVIFEVK